MTARLSIVDIGTLASHIGKKAPVDMLGIVTQVGPLGSTKRKTDGAELSRRDITLIDARLCPILLNEALSMGRAHV